MLSLSVSVSINAPKAVVWEKMSRFDEVAKWTKSVHKSYFSGVKTQGKGAKRVCEVPGYGTVYETVTWWEANKGFSYEAETTITEFAKNTWTIEEKGSQTLLTIQPEFKVKYGFIGKIMEVLLLKPKLKKQLPEVLAEFKYYVEHGVPAFAEGTDKLAKQRG